MILLLNGIKFLALVIIIHLCSAQSAPDNADTPPTTVTTTPTTQTTAWSIEYSTVTQNSTVAQNIGTTYQPNEVYGFGIVRDHYCRFDAYLFPFRYITEPLVCADWCQRDATCAGFMVSLYSGACEAFTQCDEIEDPNWVVYYRQKLVTTTRFWDNTSPTPDNFVDLTKVTDITTVYEKIKQHYAPYSRPLEAVISSSKSSGSETGTNPFPWTKVSAGQSILFGRTLETAWKARIVFNYQPINGWIFQVPAQTNGTTTGDPQVSQDAKCSQGTRDSSCRLLKLNNEGRLFLMPWLWEALHNSTMPPTPDPYSVSALSTIVALCYGEHPPTYNNEPVCPDPAMLNAIGALAVSMFDLYSLPLYVATIIGSPVYQNDEGLPSITHIYGSGSDFLCGVAVYGASERKFDCSCDEIKDFLQHPQHGGSTPCDGIYLPARTADVGCGQEWWPVPTAHCDKTISGAK